MTAIVFACIVESVEAGRSLGRNVGRKRGGNVDIHGGNVEETWTSIIQETWTSIIPGKGNVNIHHSFFRKEIQEEGKEEIHSARKKETWT